MSDAWDPPSFEPPAPAKSPPPEPPPLPEYPDVEVNSSADIDLTERQLGDYRLLRRLGRGAMAIAQLATAKYKNGREKNQPHSSLNVNVE